MSLVSKRTLSSTSSVVVANDPDALATSALVLLKAVMALASSDRLSTTEAVVRIQGPRGVWFFERQNVTWRLSAPARYAYRNTYYSLSLLAQDFNQFYGIESNWFRPKLYTHDVLPSLPSMSESTLRPPPTTKQARPLSSSQKRSGLIILRAFQRYTYAKCVKTLKVLDNRVRRIDSQRRFVHGMQLACAPAVLYGDPKLPGPPTHLFRKHREDFEAEAREMLFDFALGTGENNCAKGLLLCDFTYPLLLQTIPTKNVPKSFVCNVDVTVRRPCPREERYKLLLNVEKVEPLVFVDVVTTTNRLSKHHKQLLRDNFDPMWGALMAKLVSTRDVLPLDFFICKTSQYIGSVIVTRLLARHAGSLVACLCIESFATQHSNHGHGGYIFDFCKKFLFHEVDDLVQTGIIFALCVATPFWSHRLEETNVARALVFQLNSEFGNSYALEDDCSKRCIFVDRKKHTKTVLRCTNLFCEGCELYHLYTSRQAVQRPPNLSVAQRKRPRQQSPPTFDVNEWFT